MYVVDWPTCNVPRDDGATQLADVPLVVHSQPFEQTPSMLYRDAEQAVIAQAPAEHVVAVTLPAHAVAHEFPHTPQFVFDVVTLVSQPFEGTPSQFPKPALHEATAQAPFEHADVPFATKHCALHAPQLFTLVRVLISQPSDTMLLQSAKPALHEPMRHAPLLQTDVPLAAVHCVPQPPQFPASAAMLTSQPLAGLLSQSAKPGRHAPMTHIPAAHAAVALARLQTIPHAPQLMGEALMFVSQPLTGLLSQSAKPGAHDATPHIPFAQTPAPLAITHGWLHAPHAAIVDERSVSQPFAVLLSQSPNDALHAPIPHDPFAHEGVPLAAVHALPHAPHEATELLVSTSQPFAGSLSQSAKPVVHATAQVPFVQLGVPLAFEHA